MSDEQTSSIELPFDLGSDPNADLESRVEEAKAELSADPSIEVGTQEIEGPPPELQGILDKYGSDPVKLAKAFKSLQAEFTKTKAGKGKAEPVVNTTEPAEAEGVTEVEVDSVTDTDGEPALPSPEVIKRLKEGLTEAAGGEDQFKAVQAWVMDNMPPGRILAYNDALKSGNEEAVLTAFKAMQYDYIKANGFESPLVGGRAPRGEVKPFGSDGEMLNAMADPRYSPSSGQYDEAYHRQVHQRIASG